MYTFVSPKKIFHGKHSLNNLKYIIEELCVNKLTIITDPMLKDVGVLDMVLDEINALNLDIQEINDVIPEPTIAVGDQILEKAKQFNPDFIIGVGGGSALDLAKAVSVLLTNEGSVSDYLNLSGEKKLEHKGVPKVLIPTTAGTGSEVTDIAVFSLETTKDVLTHDYLLADYAIIDPMLTVTLQEDRKSM